MLTWRTSRTAGEKHQQMSPVCLPSQLLVFIKDLCLCRKLHTLNRVTHISHSKSLAVAAAFGRHYCALHILASDSGEEASSAAEKWVLASIWVAQICSTEYSCKVTWTKTCWHEGLQGLQEKNTSKCLQSACHPNFQCSLKTAVSVGSCMLWTGSLT